MNNEKNSAVGDDKSESSVKIPVLLIVIVLIAWLLGGLPLYFSTDPGKVGDTYGAVNALFSGMAFAGVVYAILLQRKELQLQREELRDTRAELHAQTEHFATQNKTLQQQAADGTFFQLLRLHNDIVNSIDLVNKQTGVTVAKGRDCFASFYKSLKSFYTIEVDKEAGSDFDCIVAAYKEFYVRDQADVGHYFRSIYNLMKFIDGSVLEDKRIYSNLVRAQLSSYELVLLFYNCMSPLGDEKFKPLVEKYGLLKHLSRDFLFHKDQSILYFKATAFSSVP